VKAAIAKGPVKKSQMEEVKKSAKNNDFDDIPIGKGSHP